MAELVEESSVSGVAAEGKLEAAIGDGGSESPVCRRSSRKLTRSPFSRGRRAKSSPKSPLMRMAEMRKAGLRGRALRQSGKVGFDGSAAKVGKGLRGAGRRGELVLAIIPELSDIGGESRESVGLEGDAGGGSGEGLLEDGISLVGCGEGEMLVGADIGEGVSEKVGVEEGVVGAVRVSGGSVDVLLDDRIPAVLGSRSARGRLEKGVGSDCSVVAGNPEAIVVGLSSDLALDLISAQPLQEMAFFGNQATPVRVENVGEDCHMVELGSEENPGGFIYEEFPPLSKENLRSAKDKERNKSVGGNDEHRVIDQAKVTSNDNKEGTSAKASGNRWSGVRNYKASLEDGGHTGGNLPVSF